jgi:hypothetical protein
MFLQIRPIKAVRKLVSLLLLSAKKIKARRFRRAFVAIFSIPYSSAIACQYSSNDEVLLNVIPISELCFALHPSL